MTLVRESPSGEKVETGDTAVTSVFGRTGAVVAEAGDYSTDLVDDFDTGSPVSESLEELVSSDEIENESSVPGQTLSDALDALLSGAGLGAGVIMDTFQGGNANNVTATSTVAAIGDLGWNTITWNGVGAFSVQKMFTEAGVIGSYRLASSSSNGQGTSVYLGLPTQGLFMFEDVSEVTFRSRMQYSGALGSITQLGVMNAANQLLRDSSTVGAGFVLDNDVLGPTYYAVCSDGFSSFATDTGVPADASYHNFRIVPRSGAIDFYVDSVLVATISEALPSGPMLPFWGGIGGGGSAVMDTDNFIFEPV